MSTISLNQARTSLENRLKDISDVDQATFVEWCEFINEFVYRYLLGIDSDRFVKEIPFNVTSATSSYPLDADFRDMSTWNTGIYRTDGNGLTLDSKLPLTGPGSSVEGYYISRGNIIITPVPTQNIAYTKRYSPILTPLVNMNQYFTLDGTISGIEVIPYEYLRFLVDALAVQYAVWDEEVGSESYADARFVRSLNELCENIRREPIIYGLTDFSNTF